MTIRLTWGRGCLESPEDHGQVAVDQRRAAEFSFSSECYSRDEGGIPYPFEFHSPLPFTGCPNDKPAGRGFTDWTISLNLFRSFSSLILLEPRYDPPGHVDKIPAGNVVWEVIRVPWYRGVPWRLEQYLLAFGEEVFNL